MTLILAVWRIYSFAVMQVKVRAGNACDVQKDKKTSLMLSNIIISNEDFPEKVNFVDRGEMCSKVSNL